MEILKQSGLPRPRIGGPSAPLRTGVGAASASNFSSTEYGDHSFIEVQFNETHQYRSRKGDKK